MLKMPRRAIVVGLLTGGLALAPAQAAGAFEPPSDPRDVFTCVGGEPVPGHPGFPGIATGVQNSFLHTDGQAAAAWSATFLFDRPLGVC